MNSSYRIYHADSLETLRTLPGCSVDCIVTDPPYGVNYGKAFYDDDKDSVVGSMAAWYAEWVRVLRENSYAFVFVGVKNIEQWISCGKNSGLTFKNMLATRTFHVQKFAAKGNFAFDLQPVLVFCKGKGKPFNEVDFFPTSPEWLSDSRNRKKQPFRYSYSNYIPTDVAYASETFGSDRSSQRTIHPNAKNERLCRFFIEIATEPGGTVLDPFSGSGTTGAAAVSCGRNFIGIEQDEYWAKVSEMRIGGRTDYRALAKDEVLRPCGQPKEDVAYRQEEFAL